LIFRFSCILTSFNLEGATYESTNYKACTSILDYIGSDKCPKKLRKFVLVSAEKGLPMFPGYLSFKRKAELSLVTRAKELNIEPYILRPGFIYNPRVIWHHPLRLGINLLACVGSYLDKYETTKKVSEALIPARAVSIDSVAKCIQAVFHGDIDHKQVVIFNDDIINKF